MKSAFNSPVKKSISLFLFTSLISLNCFTNKIHPGKSVDIYDYSRNYIAHHYNNWSISRDDGVFELLTKNGKPVFFKEVSPFTYIKIFEKYNFVVLLSKIKLNNPDQLEIIRFDRKVLLRIPIVIDSLNRNDYGIREGDSTFLFWYNEKDPDLKIVETGENYTIHILTPNKNYLLHTFPKDPDKHKKNGKEQEPDKNTKKGKGIAGIAYGK